MARNAGVLALAGIALAYLLTRGDEADAVTVYADGNAELPTETNPSGDELANIAAQLADDPDAPLPDMTPEVDPVDAFLFMIRCCENVALDVASDADFQTFYGGSRFTDMSNHPVLTGEKVGIKLDPQTCRNAGIPSGNCVSTAAGALQMTVPTWQVYGLGAGETDFSPAAQLRAGRRILDGLGATTLINRGDIAGAIALAGKRWASLPGALGGQKQKSVAYAMARFNDGMQGTA